MWIPEGYREKKSCTLTIGLMCTIIAQTLEHVVVKSRKNGGKKRLFIFLALFFSHLFTQDIKPI